MSEEPVFIRSKLGTSRYVYNYRNPVGLALIILTPLVALGVLFGMQAESTWSEGELRDAVRKGVQDLVVLGQVGIGAGMSRWQVGQAPVQIASRVCSSRTTW
ncbi:hypothetical protein OG298_00565 [Streptomyces sp. NBC_01005]|uniref:hypothetical protein n=1 Tax=unclassified Streptomyces TaxID=2593676 RepID=UPI002E37703C|nr:hypothetical protein [Streptomyces sp. NBC_01362]WSW02986.1 hypothetical protein OG298_00565 [Streptomyces sp. NBC_01005]WTC92492.1 hypothetical protein OH736_00565 [Streptomyces sp. NBC_01650]